MMHMMWFCRAGLCRAAGGCTRLCRTARCSAPLACAGSTGTALGTTTGRGTASALCKGRRRRNAGSNSETASYGKQRSKFMVLHDSILLLWVFKVGARHGCAMTAIMAWRRRASPRTSWQHTALRRSLTLRTTLPRKAWLRHQLRLDPPGRHPSAVLRVFPFALNRRTWRSSGPPLPRASMPIWLSSWDSPPSVGQGAQVLFPSDRAPCRTEENGPAGQSLFGSAMTACSGTRSCPPTIVRSADRVGYTERIFFDEQSKFLVRPKKGAAPSRGHGE